jgi:hypothetical protein
VRNAEVLNGSKRLIADIDLERLANWEVGTRRALIELDRRARDDQPFRESILINQSASPLDDYDSFAEIALTELSLASALSLLAALEAILKFALDDLEAKGALSQATLLQLQETRANRKDGRVSFEDAIDLLADEFSSEARLVAGFQTLKGYVKLRNWIAHGRAGELAMGVGAYSPTPLRKLCIAIAAYFV